MTLKEAKKILENEFVEIGFHKSTEPFEFDESRWFVGEKPEVLDAFRVLSKEGYYITISGHDYDMRKKRLEKEYEKHTKAPGPGEAQTEEKKGIIYPTTSPKADFYYKHVLNEVNPALKEAASQFNDALLDEQAKKIAELPKDKELMKKASLSQLDDFIEIYNLLTKESQKTKRLGKEIARLNGIIHDKNAVLSDVAEELRLTKIREKNLAELGLKYVGENEKLKKELADNVVDKIDAQALKSAESALAYKEKVIAEKDEVISDLGNELAATKKELEEANYRIKAIRNGSNQYCEYGIAAEKMIQKMADIIVYDRPVFSKDFEQYRRWANGYRFNPQLPELSEEEEKKLSPGKDTYPTEDNPEEVTMEEILEHVRKALEEGGTVSISYDKAEEGADQSATIVQHRKSIVDLFKEIKHLW